jgi:hypothetical protein
MTELLAQAFGEISRLPEADQNAIAEALIGLLPDDAAEQEWEGLIRDPRSEQVLERLLAEAARGEMPAACPEEA